ncbi:glutamine amidotransferase-related protein [Flavobacterium foetidum]|uniref:glutamine amidotransferase-related protein n=1 Tax=Flavobacterium foetidum TaxID=2026681 RepID=UPI001074CA64|nr:gamma-glutamyl-gamma-aminobutyrate hydrolase family protein [Flavobacterium foetidum]KAF2514351.1 glutamine amidotransferase [Flavobacterium foetidum]
MNVHFIQHELFEAPGAYLNWAEKREHFISFSKMFENDMLPHALENIDMLIVMGGPQSPNTTQEECSHFNAKAEISLIQKCIRKGKAVVGVCLGAQLIGEALGAKFVYSPEKEIGILPIRLTDYGLEDSVAHFGTSLKVGHWHNDMPGLTADSKILAESEGCPRQIIAYSNLVYGFQCHMELTPNVVELLIAEDEDFLIQNTTHKFVQKPNEIRSYDFAAMNEKLFLFLDKLVADFEKTSRIK